MPGKAWALINQPYCSCNFIYLLSRRCCRCRCTLQGFRKVVTKPHYPWQAQRRRGAQLWHTRRVTLKGLPEGSGWPAPGELLALLRTAPGRPVAMQDVEADCMTLLETGLFRRGAPAHACCMASCRIAQKHLVAVLWSGHGIVSRTLSLKLVPRHSWRRGCHIR